MKNWITGILMGWVFVAGAQESSWRKVLDYPASAESVWSVDGLENVFISEFGLINKFDSVGRLKFSQSIKALGNTSRIVPVNTMKLVHFSEEQQSLCYLDNTLTPLDDCIDLSQEGIVNAVMVSGSSQPNKLWILDNLNSRLLLLPLDNVYQPQEVVNLRGTLDINDIVTLKERNNEVLLLDRNKGVYIFDLYGTLLEFIEAKEILDVDANEQLLFLMYRDKMDIRALKTGEMFSVPLPVSGITGFEYRNRFFYFRTANAVHKFALQFSE